MDEIRNRWEILTCASPGKPLKSHWTNFVSRHQDVFVSRISTFESDKEDTEEGAQKFEGTSNEIMNVGGEYFPTHTVLQHSQKSQFINQIRRVPQFNFEK